MKNQPSFLCAEIETKIYIRHSKEMKLFGVCDESLTGNCGNGFCFYLGLPMQVTREMELLFVYFLSEKYNY